MKRRVEFWGDGKLLRVDEFDIDVQTMTNEQLAEAWWAGGRDAVDRHTASNCQELTTEIHRRGFATPADVQTDPTDMRQIIH